MKTLQGKGTRPTTDRIKETLFNILQEDLYGCRFLDLFAGSGQIGIEALSRGAAEAVFVDYSRSAAGCIQDNLKKTKLEDKARVYPMDVIGALKRLSYEEPFSLVFLDPPYQEHLEQEVLRVLAGSSLISDSTKIVVEAEKDTDFSYVEEMGYSIMRTKEYKTNKHVFLCLREDRKG